LIVPLTLSYSWCRNRSVNVFVKLLPNILNAIGPFLANARSVPALRAKALQTNVNLLPGK